MLVWVSDHYTTYSYDYFFVYFEISSRFYFLSFFLFFLKRTSKQEIRQELFLKWKVDPSLLYIKLCWFFWWWWWINTYYIYIYIYTHTWYYLNTVCLLCVHVYTCVRVWLTTTTTHQRVSVCVCVCVRVYVYVCGWLPPLHSALLYYSTHTHSTLTTNRCDIVLIMFIKNKGI